MDEDTEKLVERWVVNEETGETLQNRMCGFENKLCERKCIYYNTCTRNPYRYDQRKE